MALAVGLSACQHEIPKDALQLSHASLERRHMQTRYFDTSDETELLSASAAVLQDLGFNLDESETDLGLIMATKDRDATEAGQVAGAIFIAVLFAAAGVNATVPTDVKQKIRVSLVTKPVGNEGKRTSVRVTFQRIVWNTAGKVSRIEGLDDPKIHQEFFDALSKAVFLEAHEI
jgi:hypothetical protein